MAMAPVLTAKLEKAKLVGTVTDKGTFSTVGESLARATAAPAAGAVLLRVTVQVVFELAGKLEPAHSSEVMVIGATSDRVTGLADPAMEAVTVAV